MLDREHRETLYLHLFAGSRQDCAEVPPADKCVVEEERHRTCTPTKPYKPGRLAASSGGPLTVPLWQLLHLPTTGMGKATFREAPIVT